jgi:hypothetical protein
VRRPDSSSPALERLTRAADARRLRRIEQAQQRRCSLQLGPAQHREPFDEDGSVREQRVIAKIALFGRHDDAVRAQQRCVETPNPLITADGDTRTHEVVAVERQHDVDFGVAIECSFDQQQIRAAGRRRVDDRVAQIRKCIA